MLVFQVIMAELWVIEELETFVMLGAGSEGAASVAKEYCDEFVQLPELQLLAR